MPNIYYYPFAVQSSGGNSNYVLKAGDTMTGNLSFGNSHKVVDLANGTDANDAVNKSQLDAVETTANNATATAFTAMTEATTADQTATTALNTANGKLSLTGGVMSGSIQLQNNDLTSVNTLTCTTANCTTITASGANSTMAGLELTGTLEFSNNVNTLQNDLGSDAPSTFLSTGLTGNYPNTTSNTLSSGHFIKVRADENMAAGIVVSFVASATATAISVKPCQPANGEDGASSQPLGILLNEVAAGGVAQVATSGICSVVCGSSGTADAGQLVLVEGTDGKVSVGAGQSNSAACGVCLSDGTTTANTPIVVWIRGGYELY